ncbi:MAG: hypothetical protein JNL67_22895 [Planctomycetaceae bacterium]|nr:hypothetical protein [Planctomycetaceae bacterium]
MRIGNDTSWVDLRSIPPKTASRPQQPQTMPNATIEGSGAIPNPKRIAERSTTLTEADHLVRTGLNDEAAEWTPSTSVREPATYASPRLPVTAGPAPRTAAQRALYVAPPTADFFANFQASYKQLTQSLANSDVGQFAKQIQQTLGQAHTEHMELVNSFSIEHEPEKATFTGPAATLRYAAILNQAYASDGYQNPKDFLASLSPEELQVVQTQKQLADPIVPKSLTEEGARNLLLPYGMAVDLNGDLVYEQGAARTLAFPPADAPDEFKTAWFQATEQLDTLTAGMYAMPFLGSLTNWNSIDESANATPAPANQMATYKQIVNDYLWMLDEFRGYLAKGQYERDKPFFENLQQLLE